MSASWAVAIYKLSELLGRYEIDFERLSGPVTDRGENPSAIDREQGRVRLSLETFGNRHLRSIASLRELYRLAVVRGFVADSEGGFHGFLSTAAFCLRKGMRPVALMVHLLKTGEFPASLVDEDRADSALRRERARERERRPLLKERAPEDDRGQHDGRL